MSVFGPEHDLDTERRRFLDGTIQDDEDLAAWGESYDGLGDALQEGNDELNDETFGNTEVVGNDFDFSNPVLPDSEGLHKPNQLPNAADKSSSLTSFQSYSHSPASKQSLSLESIWDDKSPFSIHLNSAGRTTSSSLRSRGESPAMSYHSGTRTLQEIEAEMRASAEQSRKEALLQQRQQQYLLEQQQRLVQQKKREEEERFLLRQQEERERELQRQRLLYQQEQVQQIQLQRLQQQQLLQQREQQHHRTPPPRMLPASQSPRFMEHQQRQILLLQQQQEQQQILRLQQLEEQLRVEELERQLRSQHISQNNDNGLDPQQPSGPYFAELETLQQHLRQRSQSPAGTGSQYSVPLQEGLPYLPHSIQLQQKLLSEMAQAEFFRDMQGLSQADQEALRVEAMRKILEAEKMEEKRRRKAAKIAHMSRYNDLMTQSDKDFITRIQVSQLVSQDPYADDFYAQVYGAIVRSRMGLGAEDERVLKFGSSGGIGLGAPAKGGTRRPNAMQRMQQQVERIVSNARRREEEKGLHSLHSLQGALGKTSGRSYKAAPRQLLQVDTGGNGSNTSPTLSHSQPHAHISKQDAPVADNAAAEAAKLGREALGDAADITDLVHKDPLTQREILVTLENLYDLVLNVEQLRRNQPHPEEGEKVLEDWSKEFDDLVDQMWKMLKVMVPLATSDPHPFISLMSAAKGKKILPRVTRHFDNQRMLTLLTLLIACFSQLDVIAQASLLDMIDDSPRRADVERQTQAFLSSVLQSILPIIVKGSLRLVSGLLGLLLDRNDIVAIAKTKPGLALLTLLLTRVEVIKQAIQNATEVEELPSSEDAEQWQLMFDHLFQLLTPHFPALFPSTRMLAYLPQGQNRPTIPGIDSLDQPVWQFLAALALHAVSQQHQILVSSLREKVLENVLSAKKGWVADEEERKTKLANVDLFLHALGLDSSQITM